MSVFNLEQSSYKPLCNRAVPQSSSPVVPGGRRSSGRRRRRPCSGGWEVPRRAAAPPGTGCGTSSGIAASQDRLSAAWRTGSRPDCYAMAGSGVLNDIHCRRCVFKKRNFARRIYYKKKKILILITKKMVTIIMWLWLLLLLLLLLIMRMMIMIGKLRMQQKYFEK